MNSNKHLTSTSTKSIWFLALKPNTTLAEIGKFKLSSVLEKTIKQLVIQHHFEEHVAFI